MPGGFFHLHLISDATGETLIAVARAAASQYQGVSAIEHVYPLVRTAQQLDRILSEIEREPGIVLFTLVNKELTAKLEARCSELGCPSISILQPVLDLFQNYLGTARTVRPGAQHTLTPEYFKRIDALNFTLLHDDGQHLEDIESADVVLVGISRTSKTPTSIYLANRGIKTANIPLVPGLLPAALDRIEKPLVVGLVASADRISQIRQNRLLSMNSVDDGEAYVDKSLIADELIMARKLCARHNWPVIDVSRRSIEETAAAVIDLYKTRMQPQPED